MRERKPSETAIVPRNGQPKAETSEEGLKSWALIELYGHARIVGMMTVDPAEFPGMIRVDVPDLLKEGKLVRKGFTRYLGKNALYGVTPIGEDEVRLLLPHVDGKPARPMQFGTVDEPW